MIFADIPKYLNSVTSRNRAYQWDKGQRLRLSGDGLPDQDAFTVEFCNDGDAAITLPPVTPVDNTAIIPDELFETGKSVIAFVLPDNYSTRWEIHIPVNPRPRRGE